MKYRKEAATTAGALACALAIGYVMQGGQTTTSSSDGFQGAPLANAEAAILDVGAITLTAAKFEEPQQSENAPSVAPKIAEPAAKAAVTASTDATETAPLPEAEAAATCEISAKARSVAAAMVKLTLAAPCLPAERVTVHHAGLVFSQTTDANGNLNITVPALEKEAVFIVAFTNGEGGVAQTTVEDMSDFDRVVLQWKGDTGFQLHAREFGADYNSDGHVWSGATRDATFGVTGRGGYLTRLGDPSAVDGLAAEVYTFPVSASQSSGDVAVSVETEVAENNCGLEIEARTLQTLSGKDITSKDLTLSVPECDASGNFLVLNNLFEDMKVASN